MNIEKTIINNRLFDLYDTLLTEKQKEVFQYYYHDDLSYQEIADILGISRAAVFDNLSRTLNLLEDYELKLGCMALIDDLTYLENKEVDRILNDYTRRKLWVKYYQ